MTSTLKRTAVLAGSAVVLAAAVAAAQDRKAGPAEGLGLVNVFNSVESRTSMLSTQPHGARVQKGDVLCELDDADLRDRLAVQELAIRSALSDAQAARLVREAAELDVAGYPRIRFAHELAGVEAEIKLAEVNLTKDEDALDWARRMFDKGYVSMAMKISEELAFKKSQFALELAQSKLKLLTQHTRQKRSKEILAAVETARARELAKQATLERERATKKRLDDQIRRCKVVATVGGVLHHVSPIGPGAVVHDGQLLFRIDPEDGPAKSAK
jgi:multidrug resistance efflux pump